jgi:allantoin racemase
MMDPALYACREMLSIPVLAPCETGMHLAAMMGHRLSVIAVLQRQDFIYRALAAQYGLPDRLVSVRGIGIPVLELDHDEDRLRHAMIDAGRKAALEDGADTLLLGCTALEHGGRLLKEALAEEGIAVTVIEALPPTIGLAQTMVRSGLAHGKGAFPVPPRKATPGYRSL